MGTGHGGGELAHRAEVGEIEHPRLDLGGGDGGGDLRARRLGLLGASRRDHDRGPGARELTRGDQPEAAVGAGDDRGAAGLVGDLLGRPTGSLRIGSSGIPPPSPRTRPSCRDSASLLLLSALLALAAFAGCGATTTSPRTRAPRPRSRSTTARPTSSRRRQPGTLTVATDNPAFPPYFVDDDPTNGEGFESAVAYAIADQLGFAEADVEWVVEPFNSSYAPGPKDFDFDVNQISITPKRAEQVDFSSPYYEAEQAVVALKDSDARERDLARRPRRRRRSASRSGPRASRRSRQSIQPSVEPQVFDTSNDVVTALKQGQVDAVVVDVPTAFFLTAVQVPEGDDGRPVPGPGRRRVGRAAGEGLAAHRLRLGGDRRAQLLR